MKTNHPALASIAMCFASLTFSVASPPATAVPFDLIVPSSISFNTNASLGIGSGFWSWLVATTEPISPSQFSDVTITVASDDPMVSVNLPCCFNLNNIGVINPGRVAGVVSGNDVYYNQLLTGESLINPQDAQWSGVQTSWPAGYTKTANIQVSFRIGAHVATYSTVLEYYPFAGYSPSFVVSGVQRVSAREIPAYTTVLVDIKPGSTDNSINLGSAGVVPVAILGSATFDVTQVDPSSISLSGAQVSLIGKSDRLSCRDEDVDADGTPDLLCHVVTAQFMLTTGYTIAQLEARTYDGRRLRGEDVVRIVP